MVVENENIRHMKRKELITILKTYSKKEKALAVPQDQLKSNDDILPFLSRYNPNDSNVFPKVRGIYVNLQTSKTLGKISLNPN